uniref:DUF1618 domain-containing protein n=1 Tax=Oryza meridionalis TaxID=40149 RepID=A0A0E0CX05_9ORYZ
MYLGRTAVLVDDDSRPPAAADADDYILVDIVTTSSTSGLGLPSCASMWSKTLVDLAFSLDGGRICWVDLLQGILFCDHILAPEGPELGFVPLPAGYCIDFVAFVGWEVISCPPNEVMLRTWVLSPDFKEWKEDSRALSVGEMWASESFNQMGLPHVLPVSPVLSLSEDGVMYTVLNDIKQVPAQVDEFGIVVVDDQLVPIANYMIRFDILQNKVLSSTKISQHGDLRWLTLTLFATDFTAYLQDHQT